MKKENKVAKDKAQTAKSRKKWKEKVSQSFRNDWKNALKWTILFVSVLGTVAFGIVAIVALTNVSKVATRITVNGLGYGLLGFALVMFFTGIWVYITKPSKNQTVVVLDDEKITKLYQNQANAKIDAAIKSAKEVSTKPAEIEEFTPEELAELDAEYEKTVNEELTKKTAPKTNEIDENNAIAKINTKDMNDETHTSAKHDSVSTTGFKKTPAHQEFHLKPYKD